MRVSQSHVTASVLLPDRRPKATSFIVGQHTLLVTGFTLHFLGIREKGKSRAWPPSAITCKLDFYMQFNVKAQTN